MLYSAHVLSDKNLAHKRGYTDFQKIKKFAGKGKMLRELVSYLVENGTKFKMSSEITPPLPTSDV